MVILCWLVVPAGLAVAAGASDDQDAIRDVQFCSTNVYGARKFAQYVLRADRVALDRADAALRAHIGRTYSTDDANKLVANGAVEGYLMKPKPDVSSDDVVRACRARIASIIKAY
jgi:hypothetical protein